jgi:hypothetical protein
MKQKQYGFWDWDSECWVLLDALEEAVDEAGDKKIYVLEAKLLGKFRRKIELVKVKPRKKRRSK